MVSPAFRLQQRTSRKRALSARVMVDMQPRESSVCRVDVNPFSAGLSVTTGTRERLRKDGTAVALVAADFD